MWANWQKIVELFTQIIVSKLSKIRVGIQVSGSGIRNPGQNLKKRIDISDPMVKKMPDTDSRIHNTARTYTSVAG